MTRFWKGALRAISPLHWFRVAMAKPIAAAVVAATEQIKTELEAKRQQEIQNEHKISEARNVVLPWVGEMAMFFDTPEAVYRTALEALGVKELDEVCPSAFKTILELHPLPGAASHRYANGHDPDPEAVNAFFQRYPYAARIGRI
jgi:hypothetical protein